MSNGEGIFGSGRSGHDPVTGIFIAMRDAWLAGIGLKENASGQSMAGGNPGAALPAATLLGPMIGWRRDGWGHRQSLRFDQASAGAAAIHHQAVSTIRRSRFPADGPAMMIAEQVTPVGLGSNI
jgi:hypothetical protein